MTEDIQGLTSRRAAFKKVAEVSGLTLALPLIANQFGKAGSGLIGAAHAQGMGVPRGDGDLVFIPGAKAPTQQLAEWVDAQAVTGANRIAGNAAALAKAPDTASHYQATTYNFPSGGLRVLTFKKGGPVFHQITFEAEIYVIQGSLTLTPLRGHTGKPTKISAGDALFMPSGVLANPKPTEDTILLLAFVASTAHAPKASIVMGKTAPDGVTAQWQDGSQEFSASKPEELKKAPKSATHFTTKRYVFDGNSLRVSTMKKGGRTNNFTNTRVDVLIYIAKGHMRRKEGDQIFDVVAGDAVREKKGGGAGYWEVTEDSVFIATDAPFDPKNFAPSEIGM